MSSSPQRHTEPFDVDLVSRRRGARGDELDTPGVQYGAGQGDPEVLERGSRAP